MPTLVEALLVYVTFKSECLSFYKQENPSCELLILKHLINIYTVLLSFSLTKQNVSLN